MIIDFHVHFFKDDLAPKAMQKLSTAAGIPHFTDGTQCGLTESMKKSGVDISVCQHIATRPEQTQIVNRWGIKVQTGQIYSFGSIHPDFEEWENEIDYIYSAGIKGVKFHPDYQNFRVDERRLYPIYEYIFSKGLTVLFHAGVDLAYKPPYACTPHHLSKVVADFPNGRIVAAHMGGYRFWDEVETCLVGKNLFLDTSFSFTELGKERFENMISLHGDERVLFASDSPWTSQSAEVENIQSLNLPSKTIDKILGENARLLLNI